MVKIACVTLNFTLIFLNLCITGDTYKYADMEQHNPQHVVPRARCGSSYITSSNYHRSDQTDFREGGGGGGGSRSKKVRVCVV